MLGINYRDGRPIYEQVVDEIEQMSRQSTAVGAPNGGRAINQPEYHSASIQ